MILKQSYLHSSVCKIIIFCLYHDTVFSNRKNVYISRFLALVEILIESSETNTITN